MVAIPVLRSRVAPVLDWCSRIRIFPANPFYQGTGEELELLDIPPAHRIRILRDRGVTCLICGVLSSELHRYAEHLGLQIIWGVAGDVSEVLHSFWHNQLDQPRFWLPGCPRSRRYPPPRPAKGRGPQTTAPGKSPGPPSAWNPNLPPAPTPRGEVFSCPACGLAFLHDPGIPGLQLCCPQCGRALVRL